MSIIASYSIREGERVSIIINGEKYFLENENGIIKLKKCDPPSKCEIYHIPPIPPKGVPIKANLASEPSLVPPPPKVPPR